MIFYIKIIIAILCNVLGLSKLYFSRINKKYKNNYVRVINYHNTEKEYISNFEKQLLFLQKKFRIISFEEFIKFLNNEINFIDKPGLLITFDDGYISNYEYGLDILKKYDIKSVFFISTDNIDGKNGYINQEQLMKMISDGHIIGNHTASHYRFTNNDTFRILNNEIIESNTKLNEMLHIKNDLFCFVGGEVDVYTENAYRIIKNNYKYVFTTLTQITLPNTNNKLIHRTNIESFWSLSLVKFQICGMWDIVYKKRKKLIEARLI